MKTILPASLFFSLNLRSKRRNRNIEFTITDKSIADNLFFINLKNKCKTKQTTIYR
jgi:hypothetical protein